MTRLPFGAFRSIVLCLGVAFASASGQSRQAPLSVDILQMNVGQGDAALIESPLGRHVLIDAGPSPRGVEAMLEALRVDTLNLVIASHNHSDHIGGMPTVLSKRVVRAYLDNGIPSNTSIYRRTLAELGRRSVQYLSATPRTITLDSLRVHVFPRVDSLDQNNGSVGVLLEFGLFRALYTGDSQEAALDAWIRQGRVPRVSVLKVAHHGSQNGTTEQLIDATRPRVVVISVGKKNSYRHPSRAVVAAWKRCGARVYRTDVHGNVEITATRDAQLIVRTKSGIVDTLPPLEREPR